MRNLLRHSSPCDTVSLLLTILHFSIYILSLIPFHRSLRGLSYLIPPGSLRFSLRELFLLILPLIPFCHSSRALCFFILTVFQKLPRLRTLSFFILTAL